MIFRVYDEHFDYTLTIASLEIIYEDVRNVCVRRALEQAFTYRHLTPSST